MFEIFKKPGWRGAVGLITSYAFVLQAFLAYSIASQADVHGDSSGAFFIVCISDDTGVRSGHACAVDDALPDLHIDGFRAPDCARLS